jgi:TonB family protein
MAHRRTAFLLALVLLTLRCGAQDTPTIDESVARAIAIKQVDPVYPVVAKASHVAGDVVLQVKVSARGTVETVTAISGSSLLRPAAIAAVKQWVFKPTKVGGLSSSVLTQLTISFPPGGAKAAAKTAEVPPAPVAAPVETPEQKIAKQYFALEDKCHLLVATRADTADQAAACKDAANKAEEFGSATRFIERRSAYVFAATALLRHKDFDESVLYANKAVAVVKQGHDDGSGSSAAYAIRGQAEAFDDKLPQANDDLAEAEKFQRAAMDTDAGRALHDSYAKSLKALLTFRAQVLDALGKTDEAKKLTEEADKL